MITKKLKAVQSSNLYGIHEELAALRSAIEDMATRLYLNFMTFTIPINKEISIDKVLNIWEMKGKEKVLVDGKEKVSQRRKRRR